MTAEERAREVLEVTQADRDAAAELMHGGRSAIAVHETREIQAVLAGERDAHRTVQAFARHRIDAVRGEREHAARVADDRAEMLVRVAKGRDGAASQLVAEFAAREISDVAAAIRNPHDPDRSGLAQVGDGEGGA